MFTPVQIQSKQILGKYLEKAQKQCCDYAFANLNLFAWSEYYGTVYTEFEGFLVIRFRIAGSDKWAYLEPLGDGDLANVIRFIADDAANETHQPIRFFFAFRGICKQDTHPSRNTVSAVLQRP